MTDAERELLQIICDSLLAQAKAPPGPHLDIKDLEERMVKAGFDKERWRVFVPG